jgi:hypothetical protein
MDVDDMATMQEELARDTCVAAVRARANTPIPTSEKCWHCGEPTENGARWCDADCRDRWERAIPRSL